MDPKQAIKMLMIEKQIEIAAPIASVWKALTDGEELSRWFPLKARVEPGKDGKISLSWGPKWEGAAAIDVWEPNRRFQWTEAVYGQPIAVEFTLESRARKTVVQLLQSSFATGADWENELRMGIHARKSTALSRESYGRAARGGVAAAEGGNDAREGL
jgi:uncharacterized protein YndB with AHSA1/START domain